MTDTARFWNKIARKYAQDPVTDQAAYDYTCGRTTSYLRPDHRVLEIGAGTGSTALLLAGSVAALRATDISSEMIAIANEKQDALSPQTRVDFAVASVDESLSTGVQYDVVMAHSLLHLVPNLDAVLANIASTVPSGGLFISKSACLDEPSMGFFRWMLKLMLPPMKLVGKAPNTIQSFSIEQLEQKIIAAGFEIVEAGNFPAGNPPNRYIVARKR